MSVPSELDRGDAVPERAPFFSRSRPNGCASGVANGADKASRSHYSDEAMFALARSSIKARHTRNRHLPSPMFGEPTWDMLLRLYVCTKSDIRQTVSRLGDASGAPATTALRWICYLEAEEFVTRRLNALDKRVVFVEMTAKGFDAIEAYLADLLEQGMASPARV